MNNSFLNHNTCYFISHKGEDGQNFFLCETDYKFYLRLLKKYKLKFDIQIFAFCLLSDAIYLILQPPNVKNLSIFITCVTQSYRLYLNARYSGKANVWQKKYRSFAIVTDDALFECVKYVESVPVRAKIVVNPAEYPWSSHSLRVSGRDNYILDKQSQNRGAFHA